MRQRDGYLVLAALDELGRVRLPLVRGAIPEPGKRHDAGEDQHRQPGRDRSTPRSERVSGVMRIAGRHSNRASIRDTPEM